MCERFICRELDTYDDFGDDFGLPQGFEEEGEGAADEEDEGGLDYEQREGEVEGVVALPHSIRRGLDGRNIDRHSTVSNKKRSALFIDYSFLNTLKVK